MNGVIGAGPASLKTNRRQNNSGRTDADTVGQSRRCDLGEAGVCPSTDFRRCASHVDCGVSLGDREDQPRV